jgi:hypothetical protein
MPTDAAFPYDPAIDPARERQKRETLRRHAVATGARKPTKSDLAREAKALDQKRGWRVADVLDTDLTAGQLTGIIGVDPGKKGGWALWSLRPATLLPEFEEAGDGVPTDVDPRGVNLVVLEDQTGFRHTGKRGTSVSEHAAGRNWGEAYGVLSRVCRERGWPMVVVQARTWQAIRGGRWMLPARHPTMRGPVSDKQRTGLYLARQLGASPDLGLRGLPREFFGARGGYLDGRGDAACIGYWATQHLAELATAWQGDGK